MKGNILGVLFLIMSGALVALMFVSYNRSDRTGPEYRFSAVDLVYDSETTEQDLITGINAYDNRDGDLTGRIVVEKVVINKDAETAVVYYAVADYSGNVTKQSRVFPADIEDIGEKLDGNETLEAEENEENRPQFNFGAAADIASTGDSASAEDSSKTETKRED
ncbi:MAG: hypothetical protein IKO76_01520 [Butyrivibrio sp.]|nr:hypothetical protein [Butyrivibrio sp.]